MATRMQQRRGTAADWAAANPVLMDGEIGFETDTHMIRVGDGVNTLVWSSAVCWTPRYSGSSGQSRTPGQPYHKVLKDLRVIQVQPVLKDHRVLRAHKDVPGPSGVEPAGAVVMYAGGTGTLPAGYLVCDGAAVSRTTYAALFAAIGLTYGSGDGSTTFNLPNFKGRVPVGRDPLDPSFDGMGETGGEKTHVLTIR
jgi:hypothetical protein